MTFTGAEIAALRSGLRKAATALGHSALTGPGPGAGSIDKPVRPSTIPGRNRVKKTIEAADAQRFARKIVQRVSGERFTLPVARKGRFTVPGVRRERRLAVPAADVDRLVEGVGVLMFALPGGRVTMATVLAVHGEAEALADQLRGAMPKAAAVVGEAWLPVLDELAGIVCEHVVEFFTSRESFPAAVDLELLKQSARSYQPEEEAALVADYARLVREKSRKIRLFGLDLHEDDQAYDLMSGFVELTVEASERPPAAHVSAERFASKDIRDLVEATGRILLEGPAGSGKSTLMQWMALQYLEPDSWLVPFLIRLREFVSTQAVRLPRPDEFLAALAGPLAGRIPAWESQMFAKGRALVLVDGVDEIPEHLRDDALSWLAELITAYPHAIYVVTTRPAGMDESWRRRISGELGFVKAAVEPMSPAQVSTFVERWHDAVARRPGADPAELLECADSLQRVIRSRRDLARITTTPLLCAMVCALYRADNRVLPRNRMALYERACAMLMEKRDIHRKVQTLPVSFSRDQIEPFLTEIALWMLLNKQRSIPHRDALDLIAAELPRLQIPDAPPKWKLTAEILLRHLIVRSGVLQEPTMESVEFVHPSFQDFLAAKGMFRRKYLAHLVTNAHDPMYQDVVVMAVSQVQNDRDRQDEILERLIERARSDRPQARQLYLLAAACIADAGMVDPKWVKLIQAKTRSLLPPRSTREAEVLASAGEFTLDLLAEVTRRHRFTTDEAEATVKAIALMRGGGEVGMRILRTLAESFGRRINYDLIRAWHQAQDPQSFHDNVLAYGDFSDFWVHITSKDLIPLLAGIPGVNWLNFRGLGAEPPDIGGLKGYGASGLSAAAVPDHPQLLSLELHDALAGALDGIERFSGLRSVEVTTSAGLDLDPLAHLPQLRSLFVKQAEGFDLSPLSASATLFTLQLDSDARIDLTPLADRRQLSRLVLNNTPFESRAPLSHVTWLMVDRFDEGMDRLFPRLATVTTVLPRLTADALTSLAAVTTLRAWPSEDTDLTPLTTLPRLAHLSLTAVSQFELHELGIRELTVGKHSASSYKGLEGLPHLKTLHVHDASGRVLTKMPPLPTLNHLSLRNVDEVALAKMGHLASITALDLGMVNQIDLHGLATFPALTTLALSDSHIVDIEPLTRFAGLERLSVHRVRHFDRSVLRRMTNLRKLTLDGDHPLDPASLPDGVDLGLNGLPQSSPDLAALPTLRALKLGEVPAYGLSALASAPRLEDLQLDHVAGCRVEELAAWPALRSLRLRGVPGLDFNALTALPHLRELHLYRMPYSGIGMLPELELVELGDTEVELAELPALPKLRHLILHTRIESDLAILATLPSLKKLELVNMPWADLAPFATRPDIELVLR